MPFVKKVFLILFSLLLFRRRKVCTVMLTMFSCIKRKGVMLSLFSCFAVICKCVEVMGAAVLEEQGVVMLREELLNIRVAKWEFGDLSSV